MQALIKKGTEKAPIWGSVRFSIPWVFLSNADHPHVFSDYMNHESLKSLCKTNNEIDNYELVQIEIKL